MEETGDMKSHLSSAAAFVEGGIQDACDDACSICLDSFCESNPSTVTCCKHDFHLQCILEWCQRSSQCPMCWQAISFKDPTSQELLEAVERERSIMANRSRSATIFHHLMLGDFELQRLPVGANDSELEERIIQHLAAAAAMGRSHHIARTEGQRGRPSAHGHPQFFVFSANPNTSSMSSFPANSAHRGGENEPGITGTSAIPSAPHAAVESHPHQALHTTLVHDYQVTFPSENGVADANMAIISHSRTFAGQSSLNNQDSAGPSDLQSFSESLKSRLSAVSMRYKDSITKGTRGWKERFFSRNASMSDIGSEVRREVNAGIATVSRMMEQLDTRDNTRAASDSIPQITQGHTVTETSTE